MYEDRLYENAKEKYNSSAKVLTAAYVAKASDHGKMFFLNSATEFEVKLPAPSLGLAMSFIVKAAPAHRLDPYRYQGPISGHAAGGHRQ